MTSAISWKKLRAAEMTSALLIERNRDSATMTSSYLLVEAMSSRDDVSNQQLSREAQELDSAMTTSAASSSHSAGSYSAQQLSQSYQQFVYRAQWIEELSLFQILKTTKKPAKERTQRTIPVGTLQNTFEREDFVSNGLNLNRGYIFEKNAIEEADCWLEITRALLQKYVDCTVLQQRDNEPEAKLSTIILEKA
ncbi:hypothetical protein F511_34886 [Dorcoceras hygrometricum]|uniref:Uncharacterized protein n=1 Tax=Dorcoceras hygrometricum TaxID=472368 RepID=A0A2Z7AAT1_9LAMI|nr:hypothetical protein F511_34886 [Dorcoceras hygrometricum]